MSEVPPSLKLAVLWSTYPFNSPLERAQSAAVDHNSYNLMLANRFLSHVNTTLVIRSCVCNPLIVHT